MKTHTITTYSFDELSDEAKEKALEGLYNINVDFDWWETVYEGANNIGLKITEFDIDRGNKIDGDLTEYIGGVIVAIKRDHGKSTPTYKLALEYEKKLNAISESDEDQAEDLQEEFKRALLEEYLSLLRQEYDYLTSEEAIIETIRANEYEFTKNGKLYHG